MNTEQPKQPESVHSTEHAGQAATGREVLRGGWTSKHDGHGGIYLGDADGRQIGFISNRRDQEVIASLCVAAPDLLGVAQMVLDEATDSTPPALIAAAEAAIARATGAAS